MQTQHFINLWVVINAMGDIKAELLFTSVTSLEEVAHATTDD
ncbi:MAG: hypothetical protein P8Y99_16640 [Calditrichaceae bacterium]